MFETIKKLFWIARPISWPNTGYPFAVGLIVAYGSVPGGPLMLTLIIGTLYFLGPYNLLMYGINDVFDYESDVKNPRKGGVEGMRESRAFHPTIIKAAIITNVPFIIYLLVVSPWQAQIVLGLSVFAVIAYSLKGLRFKEIPFLDSVTSSFHFVSPLIFALALVGFSDTAWPWVIAFFLWGMASHALGAIQDIIPDRQAALHSIATALGARRTLYFVIALYTAAALLVATQGLQFWPLILVGSMYIINCLPLWRVTDLTSAHANSAWKRFLWLNYIAGAVVTIVILYALFYAK